MLGVVWIFVLRPVLTLMIVGVAGALMMVAVDALAEFPLASSLLLMICLRILKRGDATARREAFLAAQIRITETPGAVYILINPDLPGCVKIGMTTGSVHRRAENVTRDYRQRGKVRRAFVVRKSVRTPTPRGLEKAMHGVFSARNIEQGAMDGGRELFYVSFEEAAAMLDHLCAAVEGELRAPEPGALKRRLRLAG